MCSVTLALDVLGTKSFVAALSAAGGTNGITGVAAHANLAVEQASLGFRESCHDGATKSPYLTATALFGYVQDRLANGWSMKVVRLPGIHHDGNVVLVSGALGHLIINAGTSWYQALQVERITGQLGERRLDRILLTSRRFPVSGGAAHVAAAFDGVPIHIHPDGQAALANGDFFYHMGESIRFGHALVPLRNRCLSEDDVFPMGDGEVIPLHLPGHASEGMGFHIPHLSTLVVGALLPRADRPTRWDLPGGSLLDIIDSIKRMKRLNVSSLVPLQGPAIRGVEHVQDVLDRHLAFFEEAAQRWKSPFLMGSTCTYGRLVDTQNTLAPRGTRVRLSRVRHEVCLLQFAFVA